MRAITRILRLYAYPLQRGAGMAVEHMSLERLYFTPKGQANLSRADSDGAVRDMTVHPWPRSTRQLENKAVSFMSMSCFSLSTSSRVKNIHFRNRLSQPNLTQLRGERHRKMNTPEGPRVRVGSDRRTDGEKERETAAMLNSDRVCFKAPSNKFIMCLNEDIHSYIY